ncbi:HAMP domain-containing protein [Auraticoccus sp. F435]|uniref:histidine kinase n=1 Tax=Auraticoccus cholistanensis TaxID=2656650 RepID=A0A6A9UUR5_9ACTN|nr:HAMP domain-containing sensor histidine kinase [Auraticoccus cholistanensis]MVA75314.1 HAMP domain-containing protein [Auraticoccus cholistanensis]
MSAAGAGPGRRWFGGAGSLQRRLLGRTVAVVVTVAVLLSTLTTLAVQQLLVGQIDDQLSATVGRVPRGQSAEGRGGPPAGVDLPGQQLGTVVLVSDGQQALAGIQTEEGAHYLSNAAGQVLLAVPADADPQSVVLPGLGRYRVVGYPIGAEGLLVVGLPLAPVDTVLTRLVALAGLLTALALLGAALAVRAVVARELRPLNRLADTAQRVSDLELGSGDVELAIRVPEADTDPRSEVGRVGLAFNHMLGNVAGALAARQASETKLRRFVADASHELRNPLAAIRGYAELTRRGGDRLPPDTTFALRRVESEAERMTALVQDLLLLARLDSGPVVERAPADLSELVVNAVSDARVAGPDHRWTLQLPEQPVTVVADADQVQQVLINLLANARTHTPPGTLVTTALGTQDGWAVVTVADDGPGIPAETLPTVFERFTRADQARARVGGTAGQPASGTGLGLAIVTAVVHAHAGQVEVRSRPGSTVFTVRLPLAPPPAPAPPAPA